MYVRRTGLNRCRISKDLLAMYRGRLLTFVIITKNKQVKLATDFDRLNPTKIYGLSWSLCYLFTIIRETNKFKSGPRRSMSKFKKHHKYYCSEEKVNDNKNLRSLDMVKSVH